MMSYLINFAWFILGAVLGIYIMTLLIASRDIDDEIERYVEDNKKEHY